MEFYFILVEPKVPENIGAAARAIKTMGFENLWLVNTKAHLETPAKWVAHGSGDILDNARTFTDLESAWQELDLLIATTAKNRSVKLEYSTPADCKSFIWDKAGKMQRVGLVFGREESGLTNNEMRLCDKVSSVPMATDYPSLNLAQAVMIYAYEFAALQQNIQTRPMEQGTADPQKLQTMKKQLAELLEQVELPDDTNIHPRIMERVMQMTDNDLNLLFSVVSKLREKYNDS